MEFISLAVHIKYQINSHAEPLTIIHSNDTLDRTSVAPTLLIEGVSQCPTPILVITLKYNIFSKFYRCWRVSVVSGVRVSLRAS